MSETESTGHVVTARLIKRASDDGFVEMHDHIPLGKEYRIDLRSRRTFNGVHIPTGTRWYGREYVRDVDTGGLLPTELLAFAETAPEQPRVQGSHALQRS